MTMRQTSPQTSSCAEVCLIRQIWKSSQKTAEAGFARNGRTTHSPGPKSGTA